MFSTIIFLNQAFIIQLGCIYLVLIYFQIDFFFVKMELTFQLYSLFYQAFLKVLLFEASICINVMFSKYISSKYTLMQYIIVLLYFVVPDKCNTFNHYHYFVYQAF